MLFVNAIPYWHFGVRTSMPVSKTDTIGFQLVNGWNNVSKSNGGVTGVFTNALVKPKSTWNLNYIVGPENSNTTDGLRNLFDTTLLLTPPGKFNAYINFDYGMNQDAVRGPGRHEAAFLAGRAVAAHYPGQRQECNHCRGLSGSTIQMASRPAPRKHLYEGTITYEYKWVEGLLTRVEYRYDSSSYATFFNKLANQTTGQQQTITVAFIAFFGPKR